MPRHTIPLCLLATAALTLGCAAPHNERLAVGLERYEGRVLLPAAGGPTEGVVAYAGPSELTLDRDNWEDRVLLVPNDGVEHFPDYTTLDPVQVDAFRADGVYPTAHSALDVEHNVADELLSWAAWPVFAARDILFVIPRTARHAEEDFVDYSPRAFGYARSPITEGTARWAEDAMDDAVAPGAGTGIDEGADDTP